LKKKNVLTDGHDDFVTHLLMAGKRNYMVPVQNHKERGGSGGKNHTFLVSAVGIFGEQLQELATLPID
jgi:hypothetical protein